MNVRRRIHEVLQGQCGDLKVRDVRIGLGYTAVQLEDGRTGVAYTMGRNKFRGCSVLTGSQPVAGRFASEVLGLLYADSPIECSLGLAAANALANVTPPQAVEGDVLGAVELLPSDRVAMVGLFSPLVGVIRERVSEVEIFEEDLELSDNLRPASEAVTRLPFCDVAVITSTTIINNTVDKLLKAAARCREIILLGSSTPLVPRAFEGTPVTFLSGITVKDPGGILRVVSEGRGTRFFRPFVTKWNIELRREFSAGTLGRQQAHTL